MRSRGLHRSLNQAINSDDVDTLRQILNENDPFNSEIVDAKRLLRSILMFYTCSENEKICETLVSFLQKFFFKSKTKVKYNFDHQFTVALKKGNLKVAELLLKNGIVKLEGSSWKDLDFVCARVFNRKYLDTRKKLLILLLDNGLEISGLISKYDDQNILHKFIAEFVEIGDSDAVEIAELLLNHGGASVCAAVDRRGFKPIHWACSKNNWNLYNYLSKKVESDMTERDKDLAAELVIKINNPQINSTDFYKNGRTTLNRSCCSHSCRVTTVALRLGADVNIVDDDGKTPFAYLRPERHNYENCLEVMVREFAKLNFEKEQVSRLNMELVRGNEKALEYYQKCTEELKKMSAKKFYESYTYYYVLKRSRCIRKLSMLMRNENFVENFKRGLDEFGCYQNNLRWILDESLILKDMSLIVESRLIKVFGKYFPSVVITKIAENLTDRDLPV